MSIENPKLGLEGKSQSLGLRQEVVLAMTSWWGETWKQCPLFSVKWVQLQIQKM